MTLPYATLPGDLDHMLENDFAIVERQFEHLEAGRGDRRTLVDQIGFELAMHAFAVEQVLYPVFEETGQTRDLEQARARNDRAKELLVTLDRTEPGDAEFESALTELMEGVRAQHRGSDTESLPALRENVGADRLAALGKQYLAAKRSAPSGPHPHAPDGGTAQKVAAAVAAPVDALKAKASGKRKRLATDASGLLDPQAQALVDAHSSLEPLPFEILEPEQARSQPGPKEAVQELLRQRGEKAEPEAVAKVEDLDVPDGAGGTQRLRVYTPEGATDGAPIVFWIHGGGWVLFTIDDHYDDSCRGLANKTGAIVVTPDYRRAPEAVFPASHDDVLAAYRWVQQNAAQLGGDPARIAIGGESVGGNMAPATVLQLAEAGEQLPVALVPVYPVTTAEQFGESMQDAADGRPLNRALLSWMAMHAFEGRPDAATDPRIDLLGWSDEQRRLMPPTLVITDERDVLRSQGEQFAQDLTDAGVQTRSSRYEGVMHEFFGASAVLDQAEKAQQEVAQFLLARLRRRRRPVPGRQHGDPSESTTTPALARTPRRAAPVPCHGRGASRSRLLAGAGPRAAGCAHRPPTTGTDLMSTAHAADRHDLIRVQGARVNNLRDVSVEIPKRRLTVFTGVSGSGKSSLVFGTIAAESQRMINETYSAFVQGFMPTAGAAGRRRAGGPDDGDHRRPGADGRQRPLHRRDRDRRQRHAADPVQPARPAAHRLGPGVLVQRRLDQRRRRRHDREGRHDRQGAPLLQHHGRHVPAVRGDGPRRRHRPRRAGRRGQVPARGRDQGPGLHPRRLVRPHLRRRRAARRPGGAVHRRAAPGVPLRRAAQDQGRGHQPDLRGAGPEDPEVDAVQGRRRPAAPRAGVRGAGRHVQRLPGVRGDPAQRRRPLLEDRRASASPTPARCRSATSRRGCGGSTSPRSRRC